MTLSDSSILKAHPAQTSSPLNLRLVSPSIKDEDDTASTSYEMKFLIPAEATEFIRRWATEHMGLDPHADPDGDGYLTTTLYLDTPQLDVYHRGTGYKRKKYRIRRYGNSNEAFVECKSRKGDATSKQRCNIPLDQVSRLGSPETGDGWIAEGFRQEIEKRGLLPICRISYLRSAWMAPSSTGPMRLTIDRQICGIPADNWQLDPVIGGKHILETQYVLEFKFRETMPLPFKSLLEQAVLNAAAVSKYRRWMHASLGSAPGAPNV